MSKFFKAAYSSSESSDSEESVEEQPIARPIVRDFAYPSDSDDEGPKRVVRAQKDKVFGDLKEQIRQSRNARNIKDISKLQTVFEAQIRIFEKTKTVIAREGLSIPRFYIRYLVELEDFINEQWEDKEGRKNMSKANAKSLASLRQKIRKYNKDFESEINAYREDPNPVGYSSGADEDDQEEDNEAAPVAPAAKKESKKKFTAESDDSESEWASDSDASSESDIDLEGKQMEDLRKFFLKKDRPEKRDRDQEKKEARQRREKEAKEARDAASDEEDTGEQWTKITSKDDPIRPLFENKVEITGEVIVKKLVEINSTRGRKSTNRKAHVKYLQELYKITVDNNLGAGLLAKILCSVISAHFEVNARISDAMDFASWSKTLDTVGGLYALLNENRNVNISISVNEDDENLTNAEEPYRMHGSVILMVKRLDDELTKIFQNADCHSTDYIDKLKGERELCTLIEKAQAYVDSRKGDTLFDPDEIASVYMMRIEHIHYKYAPENDNGETERLVDELCKVIYSLQGAGKQRQRALLCQIYHHAIHDRWHKAKDLLLMSHLQALVDHSDASTQILYNRAICQVGLCAFRHGFIKEAHQSLSEIQNTQRAKELLAQGTPPRQMDKTAEQETKERAMQVPYHMHINLELMECVYLICSMLLEIPNIACYEYEVRRRLLSRSFHYQLKFSEKSALIGPPENTREHVVAASRAMLKGDWQKCRDYIINDKMNAKVWNLFRNSANVKEMVVQRIQEETLRTYLLMYTTIYTTVSLDTLCELFELSRQRVYAIISKMIIQEELSATLDEPSNCLIMHRIEPSRLQLLSLSLTEKLAQLADQNEQIIEPRGTRAGYSAPGQWYQGPRPDRGGDDRSRRQGGVTFQDRGRYQQDGRRGQQNPQSQRGRQGGMRRSNY